MDGWVDGWVGWLRLGPQPHTTYLPSFSRGEEKRGVYNQVGCERETEPPRAVTEWSVTTGQTRDSTVDSGARRTKVNRRQECPPAIEKHLRRDRSALPVIVNWWDKPDYSTEFVRQSSDFEFLSGFVANRIATLHNLSPLVVEGRKKEGCL